MSNRTKYQVAGDADGRPVVRGCGHLEHVRNVEPATPHACEDCLNEGSRWVPIIASHEPGEAWAWCYADGLMLIPTDST